ncbi:hypothetical protein KKH43_02225 [Patescibacteria group bacterium]|nr:hypothetical protein [Patescibacteria group bacterium]
MTKQEQGTLHKVLSTLESFQGEVKTELKDIKENVSSLKNAVEFILENGATKEELNELKIEIGNLKIGTADLKTELTEFKKQNQADHSRMITQIDGLTVLYQKSEIEVTTLHHRVDKHDKILKEKIR